MCGQHNFRASAEDNTGENTDKGHTPNPSTEIKIPDPAGNRTRAPGLEGRDSTDHATATDSKTHTVNSVMKSRRMLHSMGFLLNYEVNHIDH